MRRVVILLVVTLVLVGGAHAADWGSIVPGESTIETVRARFGEPGARTAEKVEGYDTTDWVYEGDRAPRGIRRLTVSFGLLTPAGYRPELVRVFRFEPVPGVFTQRTVQAGWGEPSAVGREAGWPALLYESGLVVVFEQDGNRVREMIFTLPQKPR